MLIFEQILFLKSLKSPFCEYFSFNFRYCRSLFLNKSEYDIHDQLTTFNCDLNREIIDLKE